MLLLESEDEISENEREESEHEGSEEENEDKKSENEYKKSKEDLRKTKKAILSESDENDVHDKNSPEGNSDKDDHVEISGDKVKDDNEDEEGTTSVNRVIIDCDSNDE